MGAGVGEAKGWSKYEGHRMSWLGGGPRLAFKNRGGGWGHQGHSQVGGERNTKR